MKKILTFALCVATLGAANAQKANVDAAKKLSGKVEKIEEARGLLKQAMEDPSTKNDVMTYVIAGNVEFDAFDKARQAAAINPSNPIVNPNEMNTQLINGYNYYMIALPYDSIPDAKGKVAAKNSKKMLSRIISHQADYYDAGAYFFNDKQYLPAYDAFMIFSDISTLPTAKFDAVPDSMRATSYYNAGIAAYSANDLKKAAAAFKKARLTNAASKESFIYEIACWQNLAQRDESLQQQAENAIREVAEDGYAHFGTKEMLFLNNLVNTMITNGDNSGALNKVNEALAANPDNPSVYGLLGFVYDRLDQPEKSLEAYAKAASYDNADYETLKNASKKLARTGTEKWNALERATPEQRNDIKTNYFEAAMNLAQRAKKMRPDANDGDLEYLLENISYALETYFNK